MTPPALQAAIDAAGPCPRRLKGEEEDDFFARFWAWADSFGEVPGGGVHCAREFKRVVALPPMGNDEIEPSLPWFSVPERLFPARAPS